MGKLVYKFVLKRKENLGFSEPDSFDIFERNRYMGTADSKGDYEFNEDDDYDKAEEVMSDLKKQLVKK